jgi:hypothetical protein
VSIPDRHVPLSNAAANWLLAVANPVKWNAPNAPWPPPSQIATILHAAALHGVLPAALRALKAASPLVGATLDGGTRSELENAEQAVATATAQRIHQIGFELLLKHQGEKIVKASHAAGIPAAIVKGPVFARRLYAEPAMRSFTDIDILIPIEARSAASDVIRGLGFEYRTRDYRAGEDYFEDNWLLVEEPSVSVELHSNLVHNPRLRQTASITIDDVTAAGAGDLEDATAILFVAAAHGAISHQLDRLQHLVDVALAANGAAGEVVVERLARAARAGRVLTAVHAALVVTGRAFEDRRCLALAEALHPSALMRLASGLVTPRSVLAARSSRRGRLSWRRKALRQAIRFVGRK